MCHAKKVYTRYFMKAIIYQPTRYVGQAGAKNSTFWMLEYVDREASISPLMGWISSKNTNKQVHIKFDSKEAAIAFAKKNNISYEISDPQRKIIKPNIYSNNFI